MTENQSLHPGNLEKRIPWFFKFLLLFTFASLLSFQQIAIAQNLVAVYKVSIFFNNSKESSSDPDMSSLLEMVFKNLPDIYITIAATPHYRFRFEDKSGEDFFDRLCLRTLDRKLPLCFFIIYPRQI